MRRLLTEDPLETVRRALPERVNVMPVKSTVIFPTGATGLQVGFPPNVEVLTLPADKTRVVAMVATEEEDMPIDPASLEKVGVIARVLNRLNLPGGTIQATVQGLIRAQLAGVRLENGLYTAQPHLVEEVPVDPREADQLIERILSTLGGIGASVERLSDVPRILRNNIGDPGRFADLVATLAHFSVADKDEVLQRLDVGDRLRFVLRRLDEEWAKIRTRGQEQPKESGKPPRTSSRKNRSSEIRKQIKALQAELGEVDPAEKECLETLRRIDHTQLPARIASLARQEAERLRGVPPGSPEAAELRQYVEVLLDIPWNRVTEQEAIDLERIRTILDENHIGIEEVKRRVLELLAVAMLRGHARGGIPCIVGPPGVGKRSLAEAIARGLGRPLVRVELGGRGEAQLAGTRRTRSSAQPGKLISAFRDAGVRDPVYLLEEIDEVGLGNVEGDPVEALEEFLDPEHLTEFVDRYVDAPFDLSDAFFIATANDFFRVPRSLREHLIEIRIAGYTPEEKVEIARRQMLPRLIAEHGLSPEDLEVPEEVLSFLTRGYARDAGVGNLRRALSAILRYLAHRKALGEEERWVLTRELVEEVLGIPRYPTTVAESAPEVGVVTGLAWTASGGELMFIEALKMPGSGRLIITGLLGEVMRESVNAAYSYVRSRADPLGIPQAAFGDNDIHIHFPVGATPKDGPSAGAAVTLAIASSLAERPVRHDIAMTGEVTLRGKILEIGGVREKILAAYRAGLRHAILPAGNERDLRDVPQDVRDGMTFHLVERMDEIMDLALLGKGELRQRRRSRGRGGPERRPAVAARSPEGDETEREEPED